MLKDQLQSDLKEAQRKRESLTVSTLRLVLAEIKNLEIEKRGAATDEDVTEVLWSQAKKRQDAMASFQQGGRLDLVQKEEQELKVIKRYLPEPLSAEEIRAEVKKAIQALTAKGQPFSLGQVMGVLMPRLKGRVQGAMLSSIVSEALARKEKT